jgi:hypothetical protein
MRLLLGFVLFASTAALAQTTPGNAAGDSIRKRILGLDLLNPPKRLNLPPVVAAAAPPKLCSVPLLNAPRAPINDKMPVIAPRLNPEFVSRAENVQLPAPPCGEAMNAQPIITKRIPMPERR